MPDQDRLRDVAHDGIQEYDNDLPRWWVWLFYGCIAWSAWYIVHYHIVFRDGSLGAERLAVQRQELAELRAKAGGGALSDELIALASRDQAQVARGAQLYLSANCATCHGADGTGSGVGPNLFDRWWIHGSEPLRIADVLLQGRPAQGMPKQNLSNDEVRALVAWIGAGARSGEKPGRRSGTPEREAEAPIGW